MRVLITCQYFPPEITAGANRCYAFAEGLARRGHEVEVLTGVPSHPAGVVAEGYGGKLVDRRSMDGFTVGYVWEWVTTSKAARSRVLNYASFGASASLAGSTPSSSPDVVLASSPPLPVGAVGATLAARHRVPWVLDVRDLWPDVAVVVGELSEGRLVSAARRLEHRLYRSANAITANTEPFVREIEQRGGAGKVTALPNGATESFIEAGARDPGRSALGDPGGRYTWAYGGNLGLAQGLDTAVEAAGLLGDEFRLVLLGAGARLESLRAQAAGLEQGSVEFLDAVPPAEAATMMRGADALLVALAAMPGLEGFVPSKLFDCLALARPVIVAAAGEPARLVTEHGTGVAVPPGDAAALAGAVRGLRDEPARAAELAARARSFAERNSRERGVERMESILGQVVAAGRRRRRP